MPRVFKRSSTVVPGRGLEYDNHKNFKWILEPFHIIFYSASYFKTVQPGWWMDLKELEVEDGWGSTVRTK